MALLLNDGSADAPKLRVYLNLGNLNDLGSESIWPGLEGEAQLERLLADGFEGVQGDVAPGSTIKHCGSGRVSQPSEAEKLAVDAKAKGHSCATIHLGWGLESEAEADILVESVLEASAKHRFPMFVETHRATLTQDIWRTVQLIKKFPELRINADYSHYYCGQEMVYGGMEMKLAFMAPIFKRVGFMHGRISSPGCMQVPIDTDLSARPKQAHGGADYLADFKEMWIRSMEGFLTMACAGDVLVFAPELLQGSIYYARKFPNAAGELVEEADRYQQALLYKDLARQCFAEAKKRVGREFS